MTDNRLPDLLAKIAIDPAFAEHARKNPKAVADEYGLDAKAVSMLESLTVSDAADGPAPLAERLSRSSLFFGGSLAAAGDVHTADAGDAAIPAGGRSLLDPGAGKGGIIGPEGPGDIGVPHGVVTPGDGLGGPAGPGIPGTTGPGGINVDGLLGDGPGGFGDKLGGLGGQGLPGVDGTPGG